MVSTISHRHSCNQFSAAAAIGYPKNISSTLRCLLEGVAIGRPEKLCPLKRPIRPFPSEFLPSRYYSLACRLFFGVLPRLAAVRRNTHPVSRQTYCRMFVYSVASL